MTDSTPNQSKPPLEITLDLLKKIRIRSDVGVAIGIFGILTLLLVPMPSWLLDFFLALSISFSITALMTVLFIESPIEFTSFPTVLLITSMFRLSLNLASTRIILTDGHTGLGAAGEVIYAFSNFIMGGNFVIGIIVFSILVLVNFTVITKGSGRIAEVAARFSLDSLPGKQMAIDADLSSGISTEEEARQRRKDLDKESQFFGAMDGASKFVRGDAVAGLVITGINIIGGILIGVLQRDLSFSEAANIYTVLTIGDGLVSQIPALLVSSAAGFMVAQSGIGETADRALVRQFTNYPLALLIVSFVTFIIGILPGMPLFPFFLLSAAVGSTGGYIIYKQKKAVTTEAELKQLEHDEDAQKEDNIASALKIDDIRVELGYGLLSLISENSEYRLTDQVKALRRQLASDLGFILPSIRIMDNMQLPSSNYSIKIKEVEAGSGEVRINKLLIMDPQGQTMNLEGEETVEPTFGLPALWINPEMREEAMFRGYTVVDPATILTTHLTEIIKDNFSELMTYSATKELLYDQDKETEKLINDIIPEKCSLNVVQRVLQNMLIERVSIRDMSTIVTAIGEASTQYKSVMMITEHVRSMLTRQISASNTNEKGVLSLVALSPKWEQAFIDALIGDNTEEKALSMAPKKLQEFISDVQSKFEQLANEGELPALLTSPHIRPYVRNIVDRFRHHTIVLSQNEVHPRARILMLGQI